jgi:hypothetical protein
MPVQPLGCCPQDYNAIGIGLDLDRPADGTRGD